MSVNYLILISSPQFLNVIIYCDMTDQDSLEINRKIPSELEHSASQIIKDILPQIVPTQKTKVILLPSPDGIVDGRYLGKHADSHIITIDTPNPLTPSGQLVHPPTAEEIMTLIHETVHQKHAEASSPELVMGLANPITPFVYTERAPGIDIALGATVALYRAQIDHSPPTLADAIVEGFSQMCERQILSAIANGLCPSHYISPAESQRLMEKHQQLNSRRETNPKFQVYPDGLSIMQKIVEAKKDGWITFVLNQIDLKTASGIKIGSSEYSSTCQNIAFLPQITNPSSQSPASDR